MTLIEWYEYVYNVNIKLLVVIVWQFAIIAGLAFLVFVKMQFRQPKKRENKEDKYVEEPLDWLELRKISRGGK